MSIFCGEHRNYQPQKRDSTDWTELKMLKQAEEQANYNIEKWYEKEETSFILCKIVLFISYRI